MKSAWHLAPESVAVWVEALDQAMVPETVDLWVTLMEWSMVTRMDPKMEEEMVVLWDCNLLDPSHHDTPLDNIVDKILLRTVASHNLDDQNRHTVDTADEDQWRSKHSDICQSSMYTQLASVTERDSAGQLAT